MSAASDRLRMDRASHVVPTLDAPEPTPVGASSWLHCGGNRQRLLYTTTRVGRREHWAAASLLAATPGLETGAWHTLRTYTEAPIDTPIAPAAMLPALLRLVALLRGGRGDIGALPSPSPYAELPDEASTHASAALTALRDLLMARNALPHAPLFVTIEPTPRDAHVSPLCAMTNADVPNGMRERARLIATAVVGAAVATPPLLCWHRPPSLAAIRARRSLVVDRLDVAEVTA